LPGQQGAIEAMRNRTGRQVFSSLNGRVASGGTAPLEEPAWQAVDESGELELEQPGRKKLARQAGACGQRVESDRVVAERGEQRALVPVGRRAG